MTKVTDTPEVNSVSPIECSIIIPTRDMLHFLQPCVDGVLRSVSGKAVELVIVDNQSEEDGTLDYLRVLGQHPQVRVLKWPHPFNFSAINNFAANQCEGEILCFLNNDIEIVQDEWLDPLLSLIRSEKTGAVGCLLVYDDQTIQHGGIALDEQSVARHIAHRESAGYFSTMGINDPVAVDAVTGACLLMRRQLFLELDGFNEQELAVSYNDVDLCLRTRQKQLDVLMHPGVCHIHHESVSRRSDDDPSNRSRAQKEFAYMQRTWKSELQGRHYSSGIPELPSMRQTKNGKALPHSSKRVRFSATSADYQKLKLEYEALQQHVDRVEQAHQLIVQSWFWRVTRPLRWLRRLALSFKTNLTSQSLETDNPATTSKRETGNEENISSASTSKTQYDDKAKHSLETFLVSGESLRFPTFENIDLSIVLVFYNQAHLSLLCLQSILEFGEGNNYEVVIVDNHSTDDTSGLLDKLDNVKIQRNEENLGFVRAVNQAADLASGKYLLLLNNDALLEKGALNSALATLNSATDIGAVGAKIKLLDGTLQEAGSIIWKDGACAGYGRGDDPQAPQYMMRRDVDYCSGAFLLFESALFRELDGFDEAFVPAYYEESDFCIRLQEMGYRVVYEPGAQITHYEFASSGGLSGATKLQQAHREILCAKHENYLSEKLTNDVTSILKARTANTYPNILIIDDRVPFPSLGAGYPRCSHILNAVAELPINLTFYPLLFPNESWDDVYDLLSPKIEVILGQGQSGLQQFLRDRADFYQTIMVSRVHNMEIFNEMLKHEPTLLVNEKIIYDAEAVSAPREVLRRRLLGETVSESEEQQLIAEELKEARSASRIVAVSEQEAALYHQQGIEDTVVLGHTLAASPTPKAFKERQGILFVGALRDEGSPNVDSLLWFLINCFPVIENQLSGCELIVVGDNTVPSLATTDHPAVKFLGRLESIEKYYDSCRIFIAPTRFAAGIPHKVHEAASMGLPSVTTSLLARQLGWAHESQLLLADAPLDFATQCIRLYTDEKLWTRVRDFGLEAINNDCSPDVFREGLKNLFGVIEHQ